MKYKVSFGVDHFTFYDGVTAIGFAEIAINHFEPTEYNKEIQPLITVEAEEEEGGEDE